MSDLVSSGLTSHLVTVLPGRDRAGGGQQPQLAPAEAAEAGDHEDQGNQRHAAEADHHDLGLEAGPAPEVTRGQTLQQRASVMRLLSGHEYTLCIDLTSVLEDSRTAPPSPGPASSS